MKKLIVIAFLSACTTLPQKPVSTPSEPVQTTPKPSSFYPCNEDAFWWAVMQAESGGNSRHVFMEPPPLNQESIGLFQLSTTDSSRGCSSKREDYFDPVKNTQCKDLIVKDLRAKYPHENWSQVLGRYWSTLRDRKEPKWKEWRAKNPNHSGFDSFKYYAAKKGCVL